MTKHLIIPGFAKAGTTFAYDQLIKNHAVFNVPKQKELSLFSKLEQINRKRYFSFFPGADPSRVYLDASPAYMEQPVRSLVHLDATIGKDDLIALVLVRDPIATLFSHYLHDLKSNYGRLTFKRRRPATYSLADEAVYRRYAQSKCENATAFKAYFGSRLRGFAMGDLFNDRVRQDLSEVLSADIEHFAVDQISNLGGFVPRYYYGGDRGASFEQDGIEWVVPAFTMVSAANERSELVAGVPAKVAEAILVLEKTFTSDITLPASMIDSVIQDHEKLCTTLGVECPVEFDGTDVHFRARPGKVSESVLAHLTSV